LGLKKIKKENSRLNSSEINASLLFPSAVISKDFMPSFQNSGPILFSFSVKNTAKEKQKTKTHNTQEKSVFHDHASTGDVGMMYRFTLTVVINIRKILD
jgi:hypothetical protein